MKEIKRILYLFLLKKVKHSTKPEIIRNKLIKLNAKKMPETQNIIELMPELKGQNKELLSDLQEYYKTIVGLAQKKQNFEFSNKDASHATIVLSTLFNEAQNSIRMFAGDFNGAVCGPAIYRNSLEGMLKKDGMKFEIIFEDSPKEESSAFKLIKKYRDEDDKDISIKILNPEFKKELLKDGFESLNHFAVVDGKMYRYETNTKKYEAFCNFDDSISASVLIKNHAKYSEHSTEIV